VDQQMTDAYISKNSITSY